MIEDKLYLGYELLNLGFEAFTRYLFRVIEGKPFEVEKTHSQLFKYFEDISNGIKTRVNINICPRSGKTTLSKYFVVYCLTKNPKSNIIYTSFSQSLLADICLSVTSILEHPIYQSLFGNKYDIITEEVDSINEFWHNELIKETGKNRHSSKRIITKEGGVCLFNPIGGQILGYGAGIRGAKTFSGFLLIDDANKPQDIRHGIRRTKTLEYFADTLLNRLNDSNTPIINIQQRLHIEDLSGYLITNYNFETLKIPLLDNKGKCNLPSQYTLQRIKELQIDNYVFQAQYQQEPIIAGGQIIKSEWFGYYSINQKINYKKIVIATDTAITVKEYSDFTCFLVGGITQQNKLHILEIVHGKWEYPELKKTALNLYNRWQFSKRETSASSIIIENRASGQQLIQDFKKSGLPVKAVDVTKDKLSRVEEVLDFIASGQVLLPENENFRNNKILLDECEQFSRDMSQVHDDVVDTLVHLINNTIARRKVSILEVL